MNPLKTPLLVYVAGPYRAPTAFAREENIFAARRAASVLAAHGFMPVVPHANTAHFDGLNTDEFFLEGTMELLRRCDAVFLLPNWEASSGARAEKAEAETLNMPVATSIQDLLEIKGEMEATLAKLRTSLQGLADAVNVVMFSDLNNGTDA